MPGKDTFSEFHPIVNFLFFGIVLCFSMLSMHPICLLISFSAAVCYCIRLKGTKAAGLLVKGALPLLLFTIIINPVFSHAGETILCYLPTGNPLTLESIFYGITSGFMLASILIWFACFSEVVTSDKFVYIFGRLFPALSLLLSMTLRFVPIFKTQFDTVKEVQKVMGRDTSSGSILKRVKNAVSCFSIVVTWSMENSIEVSDSMKSRGYGTMKRTAYSIYRFTERDRNAFSFLIFCSLFLAAGGMSGNLFWRFYPTIRGVLTEPLTVSLQAVYLLLCFMPVYIDRKEERIWKRIRSNI